MKFLNFLIMFFISLNSFADYDLGEGVRVNDSQINQIRNALDKTPEDKQFHHWTKLENAMRWTLEGAPGAGEMRAFNKPTGDRQVYGPGFYMAESRTSSQGFGTTLMELTIPKGTPIYDDTIVNRIVGSTLKSNQKAKLQEYLPMIRNVKNDWWTLNHESLLTHFHFAKADERWSVDLIKNNALIGADFYKKLWNGIRGNGNGAALESLLLLGHYQDGISFVRSVSEFSDLSYGAQESPWTQFEPENFENFRKTYQEIILRSNAKFSQRIPDDKKYEYKIVENLSDSNPDMHIVDTNGNFGSDDLTKEQWIQRQKEIFLELHRDLSGDQSISYNDSLRGEGITAGGPREGNTFWAPISDTGVMLDNPYLDVEFTPYSGGDGYLVKYHYPDVAHFRHLEGKISDSLFRTLSSLDYSRDLAGDINTSRRNQLNRQLIDELLTDAFSKYHGQKAEFRNGRSFELMRDLISIHPKADKNGRGVRAYFFAANMQAGVEVPYHIMGNFDLTKSAGFYKRMLLNTIEPFNQLKEAMIKELLYAKVEGRNPNYSKLPEVFGLLKGLSAFGEFEGDRLNGNDAELIRKRFFTQLFDENFEDYWRYADSAGVITSLETLPDERVKTALLNKVVNGKNKFTRNDIEEFFDGIGSKDELYRLVKLIDDLCEKEEVKRNFRAFYSVEVISLEDDFLSQNQHLIQNEIFQKGIKESLAKTQIEVLEMVKVISYFEKKLHAGETEFGEVLKQAISDPKNVNNFNIYHCLYMMGAYGSGLPKNIFETIIDVLINTNDPAVRNQSLQHLNNIFNEFGLDERKEFTQSLIGKLNTLDDDSVRSLGPDFYKLFFFNGLETSSSEVQGMISQFLVDKIDLIYDNPASLNFIKNDILPTLLTGDIDLSNIENFKIWLQLFGKSSDKENFDDLFVYLGRKTDYIDDEIKANLFNDVLKNQLLNPENVRKIGASGSGILENLVFNDVNNINDLRPITIIFVQNINLEEDVFYQDYYWMNNWITQNGGEFKLDVDSLFDLYNNIKSNIGIDHASGELIKGLINSNIEKLNQADQNKIFRKVLDDIGDKIDAGEGFSPWKLEIALDLFNVNHSDITFEEVKAKLIQIVENQGIDENLRKVSAYNVFRIFELHSSVNIETDLLFKIFKLSFDFSNKESRESLHYQILYLDNYDKNELYNKISTDIQSLEYLPSSYREGLDLAFPEYGKHNCFYSYMGAK